MGWGRPPLLLPSAYWVGSRSDNTSLESFFIVRLVLACGLGGPVCSACRHIFEGDETIEVEVFHPTNSISLHIKELLIRTASFLTADGTTIDLLHLSHDLKLHVLKLTFAQELPVGESKPFGINQSIS